MQRSSTFFKTVTDMVMHGENLVKVADMKAQSPLSLKDEGLRCCYTEPCFVQHVSQRMGDGKSVEIFAESRTNSAFRNGFCILTRNVFSCLVHITFGTVSCNLSRNRVARQVARNIAQCHSAFSFYSNHNYIKILDWSPAALI